MVGDAMNATVINPGEKPVGLSGLIPSRNCLSQDYCIELAIRSLLSCCEEVVVSDSDSTDGTLEMLNDWAKDEPRLRIVNYPWPNPKGDYHWYVTWLNHARQHLRFRSLCQLDADEVLTDEPSAHRLINKAVLDNDALAVDRLNFARDAHSLIPEGECCGRHVVRIGPSDLFLASDEPHQPGEVPMLDMAHIEKGVRIYHLGFLRKKEAFFAKAKVVLGAFFNEYDTRIADAEAKGRLPLEKFPWWDRMEPYHGYYPAAVREWLTERGHRPVHYTPAMMTYETKDELIGRLPSTTKVILVSDGSFGDVLRDLIQQSDKCVPNTRIIGEGYVASSGARMAVHSFCREFGWTLEAISKHPVPCYSLVRN